MDNKLDLEVRLKGEKMSDKGKSIESLEVLADEAENKETGNKKNNTDNGQKKKKKKKKESILPFILLFLIGAGILAYPKLSNLYYTVETNQKIIEFKKEKSKLATEEINEKIKLAKAYNEHLSGVVSKDPYAVENQQKGVAAYAKMLEIKEMIGSVEIPKLNLNIPIYAGTSKEVLEKGVGHLEGTSLPIGGNSTNSVLTAHSGLPSAELFTNLTKMVIGDKIYVTNIKEKMAYEVDDISVILPTDFSKLTVFPGHDYITLLTCTPVPVNDHRLLVRAHRIEYSPETEEAIISDSQFTNKYKNLVIVAIAFILLLVILLIILRIKYLLAKKKLKKAKEEQKNINLKESKDEDNRE